MPRKPQYIEVQRRGFCEVCGNDYALTKNGLIRPHRKQRARGGPECPGSDSTPVRITSIQRPHTAIHI